MNENEIKSLINKVLTDLDLKLIKPKLERNFDYWEKLTNRLEKIPKFADYAEQIEEILVQSPNLFFESIFWEESLEDGQKAYENQKDIIQHKSCIAIKVL